VFVCQSGCSQFSPLKYLKLGYKFSQDHIELFFAAVRARGGWNNNPTARQFKAAYKRLLLHQNVKNVVPGNCFPQESFELLTVSSHTEKQDRLVVVETDCAVSLASGEFPANNDHDYVDIPALSHLSVFLENVVMYISGFVVRKVREKVGCDACESVLVAHEVNCTDDTEQDQPVCGSLLLRKNRGGLVTPSADVVSVCKLCERTFKAVLASNKNRPPSRTLLRQSLVNEVMAQLIMSDLFTSLNEHSMESDPLNDHRVRLIKLICNQYLTIRFYHAGKVFTHSLQGDRVRSVLNKTVIFKGQ